MTFLPKNDPINLFSKWYEEVLSSSYKEPSAMTLATCSKDCIPSARVVLLKEYSKEGFVFFTNVKSRKGKELTENPKTALVFQWMEFSKQVRIEGDVKLLSSEKADEYFSSRTRESQLSAWCSKQSSILKNWQDFEQYIELKSIEFRNQKVPRPDFWVGFCVIPKVIEFWQEGEHRRHIRFRYTRLPSKLAFEKQVLGAHGAENRSVLDIHEDLSTEGTTQLPTEVEFQKKSTFIEENNWTLEQLYP